MKSLEVVLWFDKEFVINEAQIHSPYSCSKVECKDHSAVQVSPSPQTNGVIFTP